ncbi:kinase-like domain-containing protein [Limtongia smithiae]|uniref:kinase-like domain-containing protein n=1 Tax=Limtongia smithiae TaxID=1125753 RepID=UPI0034CDC746
MAENENNAPASANGSPHSAESATALPELMTISNRPIQFNSSKGFLGRTKSITQYRRLRRLGEGTYGIVYQALDLQTERKVALKAVRIFQDSQRDGIPTTALRELSMLRSLRDHKNIIELLDIAVGDTKLDEVYMVLEYARYDLANLIDNMRERFSISEVKCLMQQLLLGLEYIHEEGIIHRDIKMSNLLLTNQGILKIADFGLARSYTDRPMTPNVVTIWYRSPELLFGSKRYNAAIDLWSAGCIMGEFIRLDPLLPGQSEKQQIDLIVGLLGAPDDRIWPGFRTLPFAQSFRFQDVRTNTLNRVFANQSQATIELLNDFLTYDPSKRITSSRALSHHYFSESPPAANPSLLRTFQHSSRSKDNRDHHTGTGTVSDKPHKGTRKSQYQYEFDDDTLVSSYEVPQSNDEERHSKRPRI